MSAAKRRGLGRGLDALLGETATVRTLPIGSLKPNRFQPRTEFDPASLDELTESIRSQGIVQPIVVTPDGTGGYQIVAGERRWRAARQAGLEEVPVAVRQVASDRELLELALVENLQRSDLNPVEEAEAYRQLKDDFGLSQAEVAVRVGKARPTVANALRLLKLPGEVLDHLRHGRLSAGQARPILGIDEPERQIELARQVIAEGLSARDVERAAAEDPPATGAAAPGRKPKAAPTVDAVDVHTAAAQEELTRRLQTKVDIRRQGAGGTIAIQFHSEEELIRLYELLTERGERR